MGAGYAKGEVSLAGAARRNRTSTPADTSPTRHFPLAAYLPSAAPQAGEGRPLSNRAAPGRPLDICLALCTLFRAFCSAPASFCMALFRNLFHVLFGFNVQTVYLIVLYPRSPSLVVAILRAAGREACSLGPDDPKYIYAGCWCHL